MDITLVRAPVRVTKSTPMSIREQALRQVRESADYARTLGVHEADILSAASVDSAK